ncbi:MAG: acyl-CoA dehydrogenase family protein [Thermoplasmata archaeon]|nr:acyl-CoA dehydrogenase family protein [Thermoplasmata archaeon]
MGEERELEVACWRARAVEFARSWLTPNAATIDRADRLPDGLLPALAGSGLMGLALPASCGGTPTSNRTLAAVLEEIASASAAVATLLSVHIAVAAQPIVQFGTESQIDEFVPPLAKGERLGAFALSEPGVGSDAAHLACWYAPAPSGFRLTGSKMFITNAATAGTILSFATKEPGSGHRGISAFVIPASTPGLTVAQRLDKLGLRGSETTELVFEEAEVASRCLLGAEGDGFKIAMEALAGGRVGIAACALGVARRAFELARAAASANPEDWKRAEVARAFVEVEAARALVERAADRKDAGVAFVQAASAAKLFASQAANRNAQRAFALSGPSAALSDSEVGRVLRDARVFPIVEGSTEIQELILGRSLLTG